MKDLIEIKALCNGLGDFREKSSYNKVAYFITLWRKAECVYKR